MSKPLDSLNHSDFVEVCYQKLLGRNGDRHWKRHFLNALNGGLSGLSVLDPFLKCEEFDNRKATNFVAPGHFIRHFLQKEISKIIIIFLGSGLNFLALIYASFSKCNYSIVLESLYLSVPLSVDRKNGLWFKYDNKRGYKKIFRIT